MRKVSLGGGLQLAEVSAECHDGSPERQKAAVLGAEVLVETLLIEQNDINSLHSG